MADADIFALGFAVETASLNNGKTAADALTKALLDVAKAMQSQEAAAKQAASGDAAKAKSALEAAQAERAAAEEAKKVAEAERIKAEALAASKAATDANAAAVIQALKAMREQEAADKRAAAEAKKKADAERKAAEEAKKAADEAARAANPYLRLSDLMGRAGASAQGMSGHIAAMTQSLMMAGSTLGQGGAQGVLGGFSSLLGLGGRMMPALGGMTTGLGALAVGLGAVTLGLGTVAAAGGVAVAATYKTQEQFMLLEGRLKNVYGSGFIAAEMFKEITELADKNGLAIDATAESFLRLARNNEAIGLTRNQMVELTDAVQMLGRVSGASQGEVAGGLMQFSQSLAAGRLNGDELRSIMENMPALAKAIADGLGVSVGQLRAMGAEGELTSDKITGALLGQLPKIRDEFENLPQTSEQAFQRVGNSWDKLMDNLGKRMNATGIVKGTADALDAVLNKANEAVREETPEEAYRRIMASRAKGLGNNGFLGLMDPFNVSKPQDDAELQSVLDMLEAKRKLAMDARLREERDIERAPFVRAQGVLKETDDFNSKLTQLRQNLKAFEDARESLTTARNGIYDKEELAKLAQFDRMIATTRAQIEASLLPLDKYAQTTDRMAANIARYGAAAASIGTEAQSLVDASVGQQHPITFAEAEAEVIRKRTVDLQSQTAAMTGQIAEQERLKAAIGGGAQAQIDAEVATKAYNLQMQLFGAEIGPDAAKALDGYKDGLRKLLEAQNEVTEAQRKYNAEVKLGIEAQITAAIKAGATSGEIAALRRQLELGMNLTNAGGGNFPASLIRTESGGNIAALNSEGYGGRLQFGDARLADAARAGIIPSMTGAEYSKQPLDVQQRVENWHFADIDQQAAQRGLLGYVGQNIGGVTITQNGIRAMAHLGGIGGAQDFLTSGGAVNPADSNGTTLADYARIHGGSLNAGQQAAVAEAQVSATMAAQSLEQRLAQIDKETAAILERAGAGPGAAIKAQREQQISAETGKAETPEQAARLEAAMRAKFAAEDKAAREDAMRDLEDMTAQRRREAEIAKLPAREREIERRVLDQINALKEKGIELDADGVAKIREQITAQIEIGGEAGRDGRKKFEAAWTSTAEAIGGALDGAIRDAVMSGKIDAEQILKGLVADITSAIFSAYVTQPLVKGLTGMIGAHGLVMGDDGPTMMMALGGVVDRPTMLRGQGRNALVGEAGPEAVLPLRRGPDGRLGVGAGGLGGGTPVVVNINDMRSASGAAPVETQESTGPDGQRMISLTIRDEVRGQIAGGAYDQQMRASYGTQRTVTRR